MKEYKLMWLGAMLFSSVYASPDTFDIYGVGPEIQNKIISCCMKTIEQYITLKEKLTFSSIEEFKKNYRKPMIIERALFKKIKKLGNFNSLEFSSIYYPHDQKFYTTLDIVQASDKERLPSPATPRTKNEIAKSEDLQRLFKVWTDYENRSFELVKANTLNSSLRSCPFVHCTFGFTNKELREDVPILQKGATQYKTQLIDIIKNGNDMTERGQAIYLLANTNRSSDLPKILIQYTDDSDVLIRNNAMRVIAEIASKSKLNGLDFHPIFKALNYPNVTDRNKASSIILALVQKDKSLHSEVIKKCGETLINLLKLKQPNNHDNAYSILKEISHKNYAETDYSSWQHWMDSENAKLKHR